MQQPFSCRVNEGVLKIAKTKERKLGISDKFDYLKKPL